MAWKIAWKREELEAAVVAGVWDMIDCDGGGTYEAMQKMGEEQNEDCEHRPEAGRAGAHTTSQMPIEIEIDAQVDAHV